MSTDIHEIEKPKLKNPVFIEGLPGVGNVGRIAAGYLVEELKAKKFAELYSSHFMPFVLLHQSSAVHVLKNEFYYWKAKKSGQRDLIILIGDSQSVDPGGHYEIANTILDYVEKFGCKEMFTLAGLSVGEEASKPKVIGAVSEPELIKKYDGAGIDFDAGSKVGTIVGASGLLIGLGRLKNMKGTCLLGETVGFPIIPDPKSAEQLLKVLMKLLKLDVDTSKLDKKVKEMEDFIKKIEDVQRKAAMGMMRPPEKPGEQKEKLSYIG
ncbi:MAG: proteasome assembly chaperone family protein [Candidatus Aenigmarchaeota archaeon]|nr:proteasome assembly chaperone family protein [Candidatus Aenigmarchaeota archaeon]